MIITADVHLGLSSDSVQTESGLPSKVEDTKARLIEVIDYAVEEEDDQVVIAGDLFDSVSPKPYIVEVLFDVLHYAKKKGIQITIIPGNHDCDIKWSSTVIPDKASFPNVSVIKVPTTCTFEKRKVNFLPHLPKRAEEEFFKMYGSYGAYFKKNRGDVLIGHAYPTGAVNSSEREMEAGNAIEFNRKDFPKYELVVLGHVHKLQVLMQSNSYDIVCPGSIPMCNFGEVSDDKCFMHLDLSTMQYEMISFTAGQQYKQVKIDLVNKDALNLSAKKIKRIAKGKLLKIVVHARDALQVEETEIRKAFDRFGKVVRFEYVIEDRNGSTEEDDVVFSGLDHQALLVEYLKKRGDLSTEVRREAQEIGEEIIVECLAEAE